MPPVPVREAADVDRVEAVDVLVRIDRAEHGAGVDVLGQRHLAEDAVDLGIGVEPGDQRQQRVLRGLGRQAVLERADADLLAGLDLAADIDLARRIVADQDHGEAGARLAGGDHRVDFGLGLLVQLARDRAPVDDLRHV